MTTTTKTVMWVCPMCWRRETLRAIPRDLPPYCSGTPATITGRATRHVTTPMVQEDKP